MDVEVKRQLNILIQLAEADKHFATIEREMIYKVAASKNISEAEVSSLIRNPEPIDTEALSNDQKFEYLMACTELMMIDNKIFDIELSFCQSIAEKLDFNKNAVDYIVLAHYKANHEELKKLIFKEFT